MAVTVMSTRVYVKPEKRTFGRKTLSTVLLESIFVQKIDLLVTNMYMFL